MSAPKGLLGRNYGLEMIPDDGEAITVSSPDYSLDPKSGNYREDEVYFIHACKCYHNFFL